MIEYTETCPSVDVAQLHDEIAALMLSGFDGVSASGGSATAIFDAALSPADEQAVRDAITNHSPSSSGELRIYSHIEVTDNSRRDPPKDVNYITGLTGRLHPTNSIVVQGEIRQVQYYATAITDPGTGKITGYADLVVQEDFVYFRDPIGFADRREQTIAWARNDGTLHPDTKLRVKHYEPFEALIEGQRRRRLLVDIMAMTLSGWLDATQTHLTSQQDRLQLGRDFLRDHKDSFDLFVEVSEQQIVYDVRNDADPGNTWLDEWFDQPTNSITVRDWIDTQINIWNLP